MTAFHKFSNFLSSEVQKLAWEEVRYMWTNQWYWVGGQATLAMGEPQG